MNASWNVVAVIRNPLSRGRKGEEVIFSILGNSPTLEEAKDLAKFMAAVIRDDGFLAPPDMDKLIIMGHEIHSIMVREASR